MNFSSITPIWLEETDSTNSEATRLLKHQILPEGTCICARFQREGKGQRSNNWLSRPGENLLASFILYPPDQNASQPFLLSKAVAIAVQRTLQAFTQSKPEIKWPNDLLLDGKKIAGILIENQWSGSRWQSSIVGIGINVNQTEFAIPHATSLESLNGQKTEVEAILNQLQLELSDWYQSYCNRDFTTISQEYHANLFGRHEPRRYTNQTGSFDALVKSVLDDGKIELEIANGTVQAYALSEISLSY